MNNRLSYETSPYLLQHQNNPVDWYAWGEEALKRAREENKPILLSIGYSACHWCHVMEKESFENHDTARLMNENFINIKVDREERPDLDHIYQNVAQAMNTGGGWPLTVFLTPKLKPFYGGTYFPPEDRYGRPGFPKVLGALSSAFKKNFETVEENADKLTDFIRDLESIQKGEAREFSLEEFRPIAEDLLNRVDIEMGGFGGAPKFPNVMSFAFLWRYGKAFNSEKAKNAVLLTLRKMASGGIYDQLGGGFHRYSVDPSWSVPHFEKMLYDNALLLKLYAEVLLTAEDLEIVPEDRELFLRILSETANYVHREMTSPLGGFYSAQDADSEGEEGKFFVWDLEDLFQVLSPEEAQVTSLRYGITSSGNFEKGKTVLYLALSVPQVAVRTGLSEVEVTQTLLSSRKKLFAARSLRIAPSLDTKVLTSWNALMISGMIWASEALQAAQMTDDAELASLAAKKSFNFLWQNLRLNSGRLMSTYQGDQGKLNGYLDDYAFLAMAALDLSKFFQNASEINSALNSCREWIEIILKHFKDDAGPGYYFTSDDHEVLLQRPKTVFDQAIPSGAAVALGCLVVLAELDWEDRGENFFGEAESQLKFLYKSMKGYPSAMGELLSTSLLKALGPIVVSGTKVQTVCRHFQVFQKPEDSFLKGKFLVCHQKKCSLPLENLSQVREVVASQRVAEKISG